MALSPKTVLLTTLALLAILFMSMVLVRQVTGGMPALDCAPPRNLVIRMLGLTMDFVILGVLGYTGYILAFDGTDAKTWQRIGKALFVLPGIIFYIDRIIINPCIARLFGL